jgi:hypothetical protein
MTDTLLSLLEKISSAQIGDLIQEHRLKEEGYEFSYSLDNDDLLGYCFPLGLYGQSAIIDINYHLKNDIITAYDEFFKLDTKSRIVFFLPEYLGELFSLRDRIIEHLSSGPVFDYAPTFKRFMENQLEEEMNLFNGDFTLFIAVATGYINDGVQRFNKLLNDSNFIFNVESLEGLYDYEMYAEIFRSTEKTSDKDLVDRIADSFKKLRRNRNYISNRIDSEAIVRVLSINKVLIDKFAGKKKLMFFLSSTDSTNEFFKHNSEIFPYLNGEPFNFHRTVEQLFINRLVADLSYKEKLERLENAKEIIKFREENLTDLNIKDDESKDILKSLVISDFQIKKREEYVNANLARKKQFEEITELNRQLALVKEQATVRSLKIFFDKLKRVSDRVGGDENLALIRELENTLEIEQIFAVVFKKAISKLLSGESLILSRGGDTIQSTGHHLPIVFLSENNTSVNILNNIGILFLSQVAFYNNSNKEQELIAITKLKELTSTISELSMKSKTLEEKIVYCLYLLILPDARISQGKTNSAYVEEFLLNLWEPMQEKGIDDRLLSDYLYTLTWVLRRNVKYAPALEYTNIALERFPEDARFHHSKFLILVCLVPRTENRKELHDYYLSYLEEIHTAQKLYPKLLDGSDEVIKKNINAALLNSEIYTNTLIISVATDSDKAILGSLLYDLRNVKLKALKDLLGTDYQEYPEFLHTEAFLELYEADQEVGKEAQLNKLLFALDTLIIGRDRAKDLPGFKIKHFEDLIHLIEQKEEKIKSAES